jgi:hypothetical protein
MGGSDARARRPGRVAHLVQNMADDRGDAPGTHGRASLTGRPTGTRSRCPVATRSGAFSARAPRRLSIPHPVPAASSGTPVPTGHIDFTGVSSPRKSLFRSPRGAPESLHGHEQSPKRPSALASRTGATWRAERRRLTDRCLPLLNLARMVCRIADSALRCRFSRGRCRCCLRWVPAAI